MKNLGTKNPFSEKYNEWKGSKKAKRLTEKYKPQPYHERRANLRLIALISSYAFNLFSALTAAALVFYFVQSIAPHWSVSVVAVLVFLVLLEISKRTASENAFKDRIQHGTFSAVFMVVFALTIMSVTFSYFGGKQAVKQLISTPNLIDTDSIKETYLERIAALDSQRKEARATRYAGNTTRESQKTVRLLTEQIARIEAERVTTLSDVELNNKATEMTHGNDTGLKAEYFALFSFGCEFWFLICIWFLEYYDWRSFAEMELSENEPTAPTPTKKKPTENAPKTTEPTKKSTETKTTDLVPLTIHDNGLTINDTTKKKPPAKHSEYRKPKTSKYNPKKQPSPIPPPLRIRADYMKARNAHSSYKSKLKRNEGKPETNQKGIEKHRAIMDAIEQEVLKETQKNNGFIKL